ncbi:MAG: L,D-transpeptidase [Microthrixaceae bacterium]
MSTGMRRRLTVAVILVLLAGFTTLAVLDRDLPSLPAAPSAPPSTTAPPPTTFPHVDLSKTTVATSTVPVLTVLAELPPGTPIDPAQADAGRQILASWPPRSPERPDAPAIPTLAAQVKGRHATTDGWLFANPTPYGNPLTLAVLERQGDWLRVQIPVRPNGGTGWVKASDVTTTVIDTHVEVSLGSRTLRATAAGQVIVETRVVTGKPASPTPLGRLYLTDYEAKHSGSAYGPWVLPLSGYSQQLDEFGGGVPVLAIHGTNRPDLVGTAASNGCIRVPNSVIELLHERLPLGTPVDIVA